MEGLEYLLISISILFALSVIIFISIGKNKIKKRSDKKIVDNSFAEAMSGNITEITIEVKRLWFGKYDANDMKKVDSLLQKGWTVVNIEEDWLFGNGYYYLKKENN